MNMVYILIFFKNLLKMDIKSIQFRRLKKRGNTCFDTEIEELVRLDCKIVIEPQVAVEICNR